MSRPFLTARWTNLLLVTFAVPPKLLHPRLPPGLELDRRDGQTFVSLVAFQFLDTRVLGVRWPGYTGFAELNLRFYVRRDDERGVVFLREFVTSRLIAGLAWLTYNEPYRAAPFTGLVRDEPDGVTADYRLCRAGRTHTLHVTGAKPAYRPPETSTEHFFKEHRWGYGRDRRGRCTRYEVVHPVWDVYRVTGHHLDLDWAGVYGPEWQFLGREKPYSVVFAAGSEVQVWPKGRL